MEARRIQQMETERLRRQSLESKEPRLEVPPAVVLCHPLTHERLDSPPLENRGSSMNIMIVAHSRLRHWLLHKILGADSQGSQEATTSVGSTPAVASPEVPAQSLIAKPSVTPMLLDTPSRPAQWCSLQLSRRVQSLTLRLPLLCRN